jgi:osmotically-inducible protein OsmY
MTKLDAEKLDEKILQELHLELRWMPGVDPRNVAVKVSVKAGVATLFGHVTDPSIRRLAETSARRVLGVRSVVNEIRLRHPGSDAQQDDGHDRPALDALGPAHQHPD